MAVKKCCIDNCNSSSIRKQDVGVTYHKFPKNTSIKDIWVNVTRYKCNSDVLEYVCSRHFCKRDFKPYKGSKYILKSDAVPSIFPWTMAEIRTESANMEEETVTEAASVKSVEPVINDSSTENLNSSKESESENLEAIKQFIENQEKELLCVSKSGTNTVEGVKPGTSGTAESSEQVKAETEEHQNEGQIKKEEDNVHEKVSLSETMAVATSVMDMILSESEAKIDAKKDVKFQPKAKLASAERGNNSMALSVGSKVEAKDFGDSWHSAEITEVDYDDMEVLVHYEDATKKHDEWISVSSPRLRPSGSKPSSKQSIPTPSSEGVTVKTEPASSPIHIKEEPKEKPAKVTFEVGERCLARWRDNRRFIATVSADLGDGKYEIVFDDKVRWTCNAVRLSKLKDASKKDPLLVDTSGLSSTSPMPSPVYGLGPSNAETTGTPLPAATSALPFNTHLFDPTRDYLGSKSERREMKRKLNIKEIFNIGQKKKKVETPKKTPPPKVKAPTPKVVKETKPKVVKKKKEPEVKMKQEIPDAVASIIGTMPKDPPAEIKPELKEEARSENDQQGEVKNEAEDMKIDIDDNLDLASSETLSAPESQEMKHEEDSLLEETKLEKFEKQDEDKHEQVIDRIKEVINKLEDGINEIEVKSEDKSKTEIKPEPVVEIEKMRITEHKDKKNLSKVKKMSKVKLKREKKVKKQVEKVRSELEEMKKQVEEMRKQMFEGMAKKQTEISGAGLLPGEWCCKWINGQPVGKVSEIEHETKVDANNKPVLPRRSVEVEDKRLPPGWTKHMVRRSLGSSAGKWDVVLMSPDNRRLHTKTDMKNYLENANDESLKPYEHALMDFGIHLKLARRLGWYTTTPDGEPQQPVAPLPAGTLSTTSPIVKKKHLSLKKNKLKDKKKKLRMKLKVPGAYRYENYIPHADGAKPGTSGQVRPGVTAEAPPENVVLEDGCVYVGSLKVQIIENLLRCPAEGCFKNFRNNTLLKMHIKHYHRELRKMLGATPKVLDLAYARTRPSAVEMRRLKLEAEHKKFKVKFNRPPKRIAEVKSEIKDIPAELKTEAQTTLINAEETKLPKIPRSLDSPKLRNILSIKPIKRPKVLLPVRKTEPTETVVSGAEDVKDEDIDVEDVAFSEPKVEMPIPEALDFETAISTHTVTKPVMDVRRKGDKKKKFASISKASEDEEWYGMNSDVETRSSYPRSGTPDSKMDQKLVSSESNEEQKDANYMYTETGERIKIVHMKREEIINCHCGFREEDGLMVQCELCLCWQHALCHNIQKESEVPEKYTCSICLNPRRGRRSQRFLHDQDRLYEGLLPGAKPCETLRRSHELSGNLHRIEDALQAMRVKYYVATKKDHPKLYLWAIDWEQSEIAMTQERLNSDYSDLSIMISNIGKENLPVKPDVPPTTPPGSQPQGDRFSQRDNQLGSPALLSGLLSSPGGASLDLPITTTELEKLAKTVEAEQEAHRVIAPQPEAAIENSACRERLLKHIQRCEALIDARLDSVEAQIAELESQDPSFEDDETPDFFPRTKQTIQMMMRDLDTMEELGVIT